VSRLRTACCGPCLFVCNSSLHPRYSFTEPSLRHSPFTPIPFNTTLTLSVKRVTRTAEPPRRHLHPYPLLPFLPTKRQHAAQCVASGCLRARDHVDGVQYRREPAHRRHRRVSSRGPKASSPGHGSDHISTASSGVVNTTSILTTTADVESSSAG
jgi:hypothetical protein